MKTTNKKKKRFDEIDEMNLGDLSVYFRSIVDDARINNDEWHLEYVRDRLQMLRWQKTIPDA